MKVRICEQCGKIRSNKTKKFCSKECSNEYQKDYPNSGTFQLGHKRTFGDKNPMWKGEQVGYTALHDWVVLRLGKPRKCMFCGVTNAKRYNWANISRNYKRELNDWIRLCTSCHMKFDGTANKIWEAILDEIEEEK